MKKTIILIFLVVIFLSSIIPSLSIKSDSRVEVSDLFVEIPKDSWSRAPVKTVYLPVVFGNLNPNKEVSIKSVEILNKDKQSLVEEKVDIRLKTVYNFAKSKDEIRNLLGIDLPTVEELDTAKGILIEADKTNDRSKRNMLVEEAWQKLKYKPSDKNPDTYTESEQKLSNLLYTKLIEVDLTRIKKDIQEEDYVPITVRINFEVGNTLYQVEEQTYLFYLNSLPARSGWYPGDGHIHTQGLSFYPDRDDNPSDYIGNFENYGFSDATDSSTILVRRNQANSFGYKWIIVTDHAEDWSQTHQPRLEPDEWSIYNQACTRATNYYSPNITVCPGEELATKEYNFFDSTNSGHLLSYANSSYAASYGTCQDLINRANQAGGFGIIAHPYANPWVNWDNWDVSGFRGLEIISNQTAYYSENAVSKWDSLLTNNLQGIISGRYPKIIGMANSDVHNSTSSAWGKNMNYIYTGSSTPPGTNRYAVYNALKEGRVSASLDGSLAVFSLNGYAPGSIVNVNPGANNISITVSGKCVSINYPYIFVNVYSNNGAEVLSDSFYDYDTDFTKTYYFTATSDCYYRVVVTFKNQYGETGGCCLVNPVYVNLP
jgi:hypothetical protein